MTESYNYCKTNCKNDGTRRDGTIFVKENENPVGIVTDRDFTTKIAVNSLSLDTPSKKIMPSPLITINHNEPISAAAEKMTNKN